MSGQGGGRPMGQGAGLLSQPGFNRNAIGSPGMSTMSPPSAGPNMGDGGMQQPNGAPPGQPFSVDSNMGGAGPYNANNLPSTPLNGAASTLNQAGYTSIARPNGYSTWVEGSPRSLGQAQEAAARAWNRNAQGTAHHEAGYMAPGARGISQYQSGNAMPSGVNSGPAGMQQANSEISRIQGQLANPGTYDPNNPFGGGQSPQATQQLRDQLAQWQQYQGRG